jgi:phage shock protein E
MFSFIKRLFGASIDLAPLLSKGAKLLDVRTESEFKAGHIPGSRNIPLNKINSELQTIKNWNAPVITVCASGRRSAMAKNILHTGGVEVYNGGSWLSLKNKYNLK